MELNVHLLPEASCVKHGKNSIEYLHVLNKTYRFRNRDHGHLAKQVLTCDVPKSILSHSVFMKLSTQSTLFFYLKADFKLKGITNSQTFVIRIRLHRYYP